jgi:hypothetical protein
LRIWDSSFRFSHSFTNKSRVISSAYSCRFTYCCAKATNRL